MAGPSLEAAGILGQKGLRITVVDARFVRPLDKDLIEMAATGGRPVFVIEENSLAGGFGDLTSSHQGADLLPALVDGQLAAVAAVAGNQRLVVHAHGGRAQR